METYVVRIYRHEKNKPRRIVGIVEEIGGGKEKKAFTSYDELWSILKSSKTKRGNPKSHESFSTAPNGIERRKEVRARTRIPFTFLFHERNVNASIINLSQKGLRIKMDEKTDLPLGDNIDFTIRGSDIKAEVRWVDQEPGTSKTISGFRIVKGRLN